MQYRTIASVFIGAMLIIACAPAEQQTSRPSAIEDEAALDAILDQESAALSNGDLAMMGRLFTANVIAMPPGEPVVEGLGAVRDWVQGVHDQYGVESEYISHENHVFGDVATQTLAFELTLTPADGGDATVFIGKGLHVLERQADGSWKIAADVWNWDEPTPPPEPEMAMYESEMEMGESEEVPEPDMKMMPEPEMETVPEPEM
jgi:ketosteroid isomerase-like protein